MATATARQEDCTHLIDNLTQQLRQPDVSPFQRVELAMQLGLLLPDQSRLKLSKMAGMGESTYQRGMAISHSSRVTEATKLALRRGTMNIRHVYDTEVKSHTTEGKSPRIVAVRAKRSKRVKRRSPTTVHRGPRVVSQDPHVGYWIGLVDKVADGRCRTDAEIMEATGYKRCRRFLEKVQLIPWLTITRTAEGVTLTVDQQLRTVCEWHRSKAFPADQHAPATVGVTVHAFVEGLLTEITRQRKANNDLYQLRHWKSELIDNRKQSSLLDWIEEQLRLIP